MAGGAFEGEPLVVVDVRVEEARLPIVPVDIGDNIILGRCCAPERSSEDTIRLEHYKNEG